MKQFKQIISMFLVIVMVMSLLPLSVIAEDIHNTHTVQFKLNYNGAHKIPSQKVADGECAVQPEDVTREGWIFEYWYVKTGDGIQKFDLSQPITEDVTLYARWDEDIEYWGPIWNRNILGAIEDGKDEEENDIDLPKTVAFITNQELQFKHGCTLTIFFNATIEHVSRNSYAHMARNRRTYSFNTCVHYCIQMEDNGPYDFHQTCR